MPEQNVPPCPTLVLAIDGLRAAALGAYGQTAYETPAFDQLATEAVTYSEAFAATPDPRDLYGRLAAAGSIPAGAVLVTDDPDVTEPFAKAFERVVVIEPPVPAEVASSIEETTAAAVWADFAVALVEAVGEGSPPPVVWLHTRGLGGPWDAPPALYASLIDEDDPEVPAVAARPEGQVEHEDERFAAACRYAGQVMTLDACLAGWLDLADGLFEGEEHRLIVAGVRGYGLGEHGRVGLADDRLFSEIQQVPLLIREPGPNHRFVRESAPTPLDAVLTSLGSAAPAGAPVLLAANTGANAVVTADWLLRRPAEGEIELYVKPDDRWEQNDIASLKADVVDELLARLAGGDSAVAVPAAGP